MKKTSKNLISNLGTIGFTGMAMFLLVFVVLGFIQPGYSHLEQTTSELVIGPFGWIQNLNFLIIAISIFAFGLGFGKSIYKNLFNPISFGFSVMSIIAILLIVFPSDWIATNRAFHMSNLSFDGRMHYELTFIALILSPFSFYQIYIGLNKSPKWKSMSQYTFFVQLSSFFMGLAWAILLLSNFQGFQDWKGLFQKIIFVNILVWFMVIGKKLQKINL